MPTGEILSIQFKVHQVFKFTERKETPELYLSGVDPDAT